MYCKLQYPIQINKSMEKLITQFLWVGVESIGI